MTQLSARELVKIIFDDFNNFFIDQSCANHLYFFGKKENLAVYGDGSNAYINIPNSIDLFDVEGDEAKFYLLFMIGHEIAHLTHRHLAHKDRDKIDSQTIEMWADFFGAKIAMAILIFGPRFRDTLTCDTSNEIEPLNAIFHALIDRLFPVFKGADGKGKYLNSNERISILVAGIAAFLTRGQMFSEKRFSEEDHARIATGWGYTVNLRLFESGLMDKLVSSQPNEALSDSAMQELMTKTIEIHSALKGEHEFKLIKGLHPAFDYMLDTTFAGGTPNPLLINSMNAMAKQVGWATDEE